MPLPQVQLHKFQLKSTTGCLELGCAAFPSLGKGLALLLGGFKPAAATEKGTEKTPGVPAWLWMSTLNNVEMILK